LLAIRLTCQLSGNAQQKFIVNAHRQRSSCLNHLSVCCPIGGRSSWAYSEAVKRLVKQRAERNFFELFFLLRGQCSPIAIRSCIVPQIFFRDFRSSLFAISALWANLRHAFPRPEGDDFFWEKKRRQNASSRFFVKLTWSRAVVSAPSFPPRSDRLWTAAGRSGAKLCKSFSFRTLRFAASANR